MPAETLLHDLSDSPACAKARICLTLKGVPFRRMTLTVRGLRRLRALNPQGEGPVPDHAGRGPDRRGGGHAARPRIRRSPEGPSPAPPLLPEEPAARAYCDLVEDWADGSLAFVMGAFRWLNRENREVALGTTARELGGGPLVRWALGARFRLRYRAAGYSAASLAHFEERLVGQLCTLAALLGQRASLPGRTLTRADVAVFAQLAPLRRFVEAPRLDAQPGVARWLERVAALPAVVLALAA